MPWVSVTSTRGVDGISRSELSRLDVLEGAALVVRCLRDGLPPRVRDPAIPLVSHCRPFWIWRAIRM